MRFTGKKEVKKGGARGKWKRSKRGFESSDGTVISKTRATFVVKGLRLQFSQKELSALWGKVYSALSMMKKLS